MSGFTRALDFMIKVLNKANLEDIGDLSNKQLKRIEDFLISNFNYINDRDGKIFIFEERHEILTSHDYFGRLDCIYVDYEVATMPYLKKLRYPPEVKFINLTPHVINLPDRTIPPSGKVARVSEESEQLYELGGIPILRKKFKIVHNLPDPQPNVYYVVSYIVAQTVQGRRDILIPGGLIRNGRGRVTGCKYFCVI